MGGSSRGVGCGRTRGGGLGGLFPPGGGSFLEPPKFGKNHDQYAYGGVSNT